MGAVYHGLDMVPYNVCLLTYIGCPQGKVPNPFGTGCSFPIDLFETSTGTYTPCHSLEVSGGASLGFSGTYELSDKRADAAPNNLVWEKAGEDRNYDYDYDYDFLRDMPRFIFNTGDGKGWRLGVETGLTDGLYWYIGKR